MSVPQNFVRVAWVFAVGEVKVVVVARDLIFYVLQVKARIEDDDIYVLRGDQF